MFLTGYDAEDHARTLGRCLAALGRPAIVELLDHEGDLAGCVSYPARTQGSAS
jgi:hypothetical protein